MSDSPFDSVDDKSVSKSGDKSFDGLLDSLVSDLKPVKPLLSPWQFALVAFFTILGLATTLFLALSSLRTSWARLYEAPVYWLSDLLFLTAMILSLVAMGRARLPGLAVRSWLKGSILFSALAALFMISCAILSRAQSAEIQPNALTMAQGGWFCSVRALVAGGVATVVLLMLLRRGFVSSVASTAVSLFLFSSAVGVVLLPGWCESENFAHIAISHWLLPSILLGVTVVAGVRVSVQVTNYSIGRRRA